MRKLPTHPFADRSPEALGAPSPRHPIVKDRQLAGHDVDSLGDWLAATTGCSVARGRRAAAKALRHAFGRPGAWTEAALESAKIGRWARSALLQLSPAPCLSIAERAPSSDGTVRLLLRALDGALIESVIIPAGKGRDRLRITLCVSSQVGCARACSFCETGVGGLDRQLTAAEIVDQYRIAADICRGAERPLDARDGPAENAAAAAGAIDNIVFMGMGEPFDNLGEVTQAIAALSTQQGLAFPASRITVSTVGVADKLGRFFADTRAELAISLNAPDDARRSAIMPINRRFDMARLREALVATLPKTRRVLFQYAIFAGFNDSLADADLVADYVAPIRCRVNVIPANPGPDASLRAPDDATVDAFVLRLQERGITALVRKPRGRDVGGACGQLAGQRRLELT